MLRSDQTLWLLVSTVLVMLTLPGVALFYGGMVRTKNVLNTMGMPLLALVLVSLQWLCLGDALTFGGGAGSPAGQLAYQMMTAALALALVTGALVERMKLLFFLVFGLLWTALVYAPLAHWLWGGGWLANLGALDFAGGAVIHVSAGVSALVAAEPSAPIVLRSRVDVGGLVRVFRRRLDGADDHGDRRICGDPGVRSSRGINVDGGRMAATGQAHSLGNGQRGRGRACGDYSGRRLCRPFFGGRHRDRSRRALLYGGELREAHPGV
jgi:hypothetical protein